MHHSRSRSLLLTALTLAACAGSLRAEVVPILSDTAGAVKDGATTLTKAGGAAKTLAISPKSTAFIRFAAGDTGILPSEVAAARLTIYIVGVTKAGNIQFRPVTTAFIEDFPEASRVAPAVGGIILSTAAVKGQYITLDVTGQVLEWLATPQPTGFGIAIQSDGTANVVIASKEGAGSGHPAVLEIDLAPAAGPADDATSANTAGAIVKRDASGNFSAGTITATFIGNGAGLTGVSATPADGSVTSVKLASGLTLGGTTVVSGGLSLPATTSSTVGVITQGGASLIHTFGTSNFFAGPSAGNFSMTGTSNTGIGNQALSAVTTGSGNIGLGINAGTNITTGSNNIAIGHPGAAGTSGVINIGTTGVHTSAVIAGNVFGGSLNATNANGSFSLDGGSTPSSGTTLQGRFTGTSAGPQIRFKNSGSASFIDIGEDALNNFVVEASDVAAMTVLQNGNVGIGTAAATASTRLHVVGSGGNTSSPTGHVSLIKENSGFTAVLALQSNFSGNHNASDNFITFFNSNGTSIGSIEGNGAGSVQLGGAGGDYAEYLVKSDPAMKIDATEIVGVRDGKIVSHGQPADQFMIVTGQAIVAGNRPSEDAADLAKSSLVSFVGQVPVQVRGKVNSGDFILASEKGDGTGIALPASKIDPAAMPRVVGRAWEASKEDGLKTVNTAVGLDQTSLVVPALQRLERENQELRERMGRLEKLLLEKPAASGLVQ